MTFHRNTFARSRNVRAAALAILITLVSYGVVKAAAIVEAVVNCSSPTACQKYSNARGNGLLGQSTNTKAADQFHELGMGAYGSGGNGIYATSLARNAGYFDGQNNAYFSLFANNTVSGGYLIGAANDADGGTLSLDSFGNLSISGTLSASSAIKVRQPSSNVDVDAYAAESTAQTLEDVGTGRIVAGRGVVRLDATFARTIEPNYFVFVTPLGKNHGLYVSGQNGVGFEVRESEGSETLAFNYRIVATPLGSKHLHLPAAVRLGHSTIAGHVP